jgi:lysozyme
MPRQVNQRGRDLTRSFETFVPFTYDDAYYPPRPARVDVPVKGTLTIGFGQTGPDAYFGNRWTQDQADAAFEISLGKAAAAVERDTAGIALTDNQFAALTDFLYNAGLGNFEHSTLLKDLLAGDLADVPAEMARWDHVDGRVSPGLDRRRAAEIALWNLPDDAPAQAPAAPSPVASPLEGEVGAQAPGGRSTQTFTTLDAAIAADAAHQPEALP